MPRELDVYLHHHRVGSLIQDDDGDVAFSYFDEWLESRDAAPLSHSLPLRKERFRSKHCRGYFGGVLPEQHQRELIARNLGISARNDYAMLERIGGECAGAVTFLPKGTAFPQPLNTYRQLSPPELAAILRELPRRPLLAGEQGVRLSLAGAQDKLAVRVESEGISLPLDASPSTHILKPAIDRFDGLVFNETLCMQLARAVGLPVARVEVRQVENIDFLLVERYDRRHQGTRIERLHQEDFCQALGVASERKYQREGGPGLSQCFSLVREVSTAPVIDLARLLDAVIFNYLVGNNDAHAKNFSLLYTSSPNREVRLAPLYDVVSTAAYPELSPEMAMRIGRHYESARVTASDFDELAVAAGLAKPLVRTRVRELTDRLLEVLSEMPELDAAAQRVRNIIQSRTEATRARVAR